jgi:hypothetical protein
MGFFSKIFKGVKKVFKKIGKGIKKAFKGIGKFMGKIGIIGQIGLSLLLPGIGTMLGGLAGSMITSGGSALIKGAGHFLKAAVNVGSKLGGMVKTVTQGVTNVIGNVAGSVLNKIPGADSLVKSVTGLDINNASFGNAVKAAQSTVTDFASQGRDLFSMDTLTSDKFITSGTKAQIEAAKSGVPSTEDILETSGQMPAPSADMEAYMEAGPRPTSTITADDIYTRGSASLTAGPDTMIPLEPRTSLLEPTNVIDVAADTDAFAGVDISKVTPEVGVPEATFGQKLAAVPGQLKDKAGEYVQGKVEALQDPMSLAKAGFETFAQTRREDEMLAAQQAALAGGDVINVGQYQDPSAFLTYQTQNTVAPIQGFQAPSTYDAPLSSWGQQFMFDPFAQQTVRTA